MNRFPMSSQLVPFREFAATLGTWVWADAIVNDAHVTVGIRFGLETARALVASETAFVLTANVVVPLALVRESGTASATVEAGARASGFVGTIGSGRRWMGRLGDDGDGSGLRLWRGRHLDGRRGRVHELGGSVALPENVMHARSEPLVGERVLLVWVNRRLLGVRGRR